MKVRRKGKENIHARICLYCDTQMVILNSGTYVCVAGPLVARAAAYTAAVVGGLTLTAACAPSEKYLNMGGPLALGLGVVFVASIGE